MTLTRQANRKGHQLSCDHCHQAIEPGRRYYQEDGGPVYCTTACAQAAEDELTSLGLPSFTGTLVVVA